MLFCPDKFTFPILGDDARWFYTNPYNDNAGRLRDN